MTSNRLLSKLVTSVQLAHFEGSRKMARFVLVHGAWHGGWCWERIAPLLGAAGHEVLAPDLPGMGADRTPFAADVLAQWADFVAGLVRGAAEPAVLVGHSRGGLVISEAAERAPDQIRVLVYLAALLLPVGTTSRQTLNADGRSVLELSPGWSDRGRPAVGDVPSNPCCGSMSLCQRPGGTADHCLFDNQRHWHR